MEDLIIPFIISICMIYRFIWIMLNSDKIKGKYINGIINYDKYNYTFMGKNFSSYAFNPISIKKEGKEYTIWVNKNKPEKIYSKFEVASMGMGFIFILICIRLLTMEL